MLRAERIFEPAGIADELAAYNPLIPDGSNWKVTLLIEFADPGSGAIALARLRGFERRCWVQVDGHERVWAIADEDLERETDEKTSAVHFLRFELEPPMRQGAQGRRQARRRRRSRALSTRDRARAGLKCASRSSPISTSHRQHACDARRAVAQHGAHSRARLVQSRAFRSAGPGDIARDGPVLHRLRYRGPERPRPRASPAGDVHRHPHPESSRSRSHRQQRR